MTKSEGLQPVQEPIQIKGEIGAEYTPTETALPHGGGCQSLATYQRFPIHHVYVRWQTSRH